MSIFDSQSTPVDFVPEQDTTNNSAERDDQEYQGEEEEQYDDQHEEHTDDEETDPSGHSEELIAGKYRTQEDLINAYKALERKLHAPQQPPQQQEQPQYQPRQMSVEEQRDEVIRMLNEDPIGTLNYFVNQAVNPIQQERAMDRTIANIEKIGMSYAQVNSEEGLGQLLGKVKEIAEDFGNPNLSRNPTPRVLEMAAKELWGTQSMSQVYQQAKAAGRQEADASRRAKAGLAAPGSTKPREAPKTAGDSIREGILAASRGSGLFSS